MSAFDDAAREMDQLAKRLADLETQVKDLLARRDGPARVAYKPSEVAAMTGFSDRAVRMWISEGRLPAEDMGNGRYAIPAWAVEQLVPRRSARRSA
jgi:excisionase family DNA binding protein